MARDGSIDGLEMVDELKENGVNEVDDLVVELDEYVDVGLLVEDDVELRFELDEELDVEVSLGVEDELRAVATGEDLEDDEDDVNRVVVEEGLGVKVCAKREKGREK